MKRLFPKACCAAALLALSGCSGWQSALDPKGPAAGELAWLIWFFTALCAAVWMLVMVVLVATLFQRVRTGKDPLVLDLASEHRKMRVVLTAVGVTAAILIGLTLLSFFANRTLAGIGSDEALTVRVTGHQWWWEVRYENAQPSRILTTANEIHIPAGEPVRLLLTSTDVIHSFWVPSLAGKLDLIPGHMNVLDIRADKPGVYRGQCAEFCGAQHANMGTFIIAEPRPQFDAWLDDQLRPAAAPTNAEAKAGADLFLQRPCVMCHRIGGTPAGGTVAPDLTHIASRQTLAAGTLTMSRGNLAAWIADPQGIKPGSHMPVTALNGDELNAIIAYLEGLK
ncbi:MULTISPECIES: cytochrome c oxidase subunit II [unclassified Mesorhizobium]|uniref:cytochrome c oxidase subunit II n=1 Tax=unclassified Mesorhizobium TaxID=325217 RepID=UPI00112E201F|nr:MULTISPECIES: cytochrome c oxidase subunit II [unclassified Mesorhizobium]MBZ9985030.1 cytochrome c oxidase subunit II [Mesorhizobium sp. BR-1-1-8]TPJ64360.1 cytochrome c oxidase subunit II [Mesorhizobium sp. B2-6-1]TPL27470.1 cytochrome c oxidase subunit II [Mesorhizobium sp. B2-4-8]TPL53561.1 cytochrome c oxidase subunit II [Mesorhizobium sp. B2-4-2]TPL59360.1 cytochrome c oxidase subunit II [Mesorhizobium sp. B2-4-1]